MRVLVLSPMLPFPPSSGGRIRIFHLLKGLSASHDVTLLAGINEESERDLAPSLNGYCSRVYTAMVPVARRRLTTHFARLCSSTPYYRVVMSSAPFERRLAAITEERRFDIVQAEYLAVAHLALSVRATARILDMHNIESTYFRRLLRRGRSGLQSLLLLSDAAKLPRYQRSVIPRFDRCLTVSEVDAQQLRQLVPRAQIAVIPNGVDPEEFQPQQGLDQPHTLVFTASFTYAPNVDAMIYFCHQILPLIRASIPEVRIIIAGQEPPSEITALRRLPGVEVTGRVPDIRPYLAQAAVVIVPLRWGAGTRLKLLEAMAMAKPVVSSSIGAEGLRVRPGYDVEIADDAAAFAEKTVALLRDPERRGRLGSRARQAVMGDYAWSRISGRLDAVYQELQPQRAGVYTALGKAGT